MSVGSVNVRYVVFEDGAALVRVDLALWGKSRGLPTPYPLVCHLLDAAAMVEVLWDQYLTTGQRRAIADGLGVGESHARQLLMFWAGLHDLGKIIPGFQASDQKAAAALAGYPGLTVGDLAHDHAVHLWLAKALGDLGYKIGGFAPRLPGVRVAAMLGGHHGRFLVVDPRDLSDPEAKNSQLGRGVWREQRQEHLRTVWELTGRPAPPEKVDTATTALICGVIVLADWLVSQESFLSVRLAYVPASSDLASLGAHLAASRQEAPSLLLDAGLAAVGLREGSFAEEFPAADPPFALQESIAKELPLVAEGPGILVVMAPMGTGKTEIALHAARLLAQCSGACGLVFALPTMATADQMYVRIHEYASRRGAGVLSQTLVHSMAALNPDYLAMRADPNPVVTGEGGTEGSASVVATEWLRTGRRGLLAGVSVCTIDQVLTMVLPVRHNTLRLLGLTGKVLVIDEAHAYDAYMQGLLRRLLYWLGYFGVPVVLLSATLPKLTAQRLVDSYLAAKGGKGPSIDFEYPGWAYVNARGGEVTTRAVGSPKRSLAVRTVPVRVADDGEPDRLPALTELLRPIMVRGCALVICATVADAQVTYRKLREWLESMPDAPRLGILHARFPVAQRRELTEGVMRDFGKRPENRPDRAILVSTSIIEQSLDLDLDLVISDLAPMAQLLQRAGRCWRHERPAVVRGEFTGPGLAVLLPHTEKGELLLPKTWLSVHDRALLERTSATLVGVDRIHIPDDVQGLVERVYDTDFAKGTSDAEMEWLAEEGVREQLAKMVAVRAPDSLSALHELSHVDGITEDLIATRLGVDSVRVLCCYLDASGERYLDPGRSRPLPESGSGREGRFRSEETRALIERTIPVRAGKWTSRRGPVTEPPLAWRDNPWLKNIVLIPFTINSDGTPERARIGSTSFELDPEVGLIVES